MIQHVFSKPSLVNLISKCLPDEDTCSWIDTVLSCQLATLQLILISIIH